MRSLILTSLILGIALASIGCCGYSCHFMCNHYPKVHVETEETLTLSPEGIDKINVGTYNGKIELRADPAAVAISVDISKKASAEDLLEAEMCMKEILIITDTQGSEQELRWEWADKQKARDRHWQASVSFSIVLPPHMSTKCETYNGRVELTGMIGESKVVTYNGSIHMKNHEGDLDVETYNGDIETTSLSPNFKIETYNGDVTSHMKSVSCLDGKIHTYNGRIKLDIDGQPSTKISAKLYNGRIRANNENLTSELSKKRKYEGVIGTGEGEVKLETYNGSIEIN